MHSEGPPPAPLTSDIAAFRNFNRLYTRFIGTLQEGLLETPYTLGEARVLYELATRPSPRASEIAAALGLDPGYLSRLLAGFQRAGLLRRQTSAEDSRFALITLTSRGRAVFKKLNTLSDLQARAILAPLAHHDRTRLIHSMRTIEDILEAPVRARPLFVLRPHRIGDMGWVISREGTLYAEEYGWDQSFEILVARIVADFLANFDPDRERCWIADADGRSPGHIFLVRHPDRPDTARLRLLLVEPSARGMGLGHTLVNECVRFARTAGYRKVVLWTQSILVAAHRIYQAAGFRLVREEPHHSFGKDLIGQTWELNFTPRGQDGR